MLKPDHKYSGDNSGWFWDRVERLEDHPDHRTIYALGCTLQNVEEQVLKALHNAEATKREE